LLEPQIPLSSPGHDQSNVAHVKPDYGLDAPGIVRNLALGGLAAAVVAGLVQVLPFTQGDRNIASAWFGLIAFVLLVEVGWMLYSSRVGKLRMRALVVGALGLRGNEKVLDVGCGRGLLLVEAAKRLPEGEAIGLDLWSARDLSGNRPEKTMENARLEGVEQRIRLETGDMRKMPFAEASFDAAVASLAIHNVPDREGRSAAVREIARVLRPGGRVALLDFVRTGEYVNTLGALGWTDVRRTGYSLHMFPPVRIVLGSRPADPAMNETG
jgi:arsenite methyltransferase